MFARGNRKPKVSTSSVDPRDPGADTPVSQRFHRIALSSAAAPGKLRQVFEPPAFSGQDAPLAERVPASPRMYLSEEDALRVRELAEKEGPAEVQTVVLQDVETLMFPNGFTVPEAVEWGHRAKAPLLITDSEFLPDMPMAIVLDGSRLAGHVVRHEKRRAFVPRRRWPWPRRLER